MDHYNFPRISSSNRYTNSSSSCSTNSSSRNQTIIVPKGFEVTSHPIFQNFQAPVFRPRPNNHSRSKYNAEHPNKLQRICLPSETSSSSAINVAIEERNTDTGMQSSATCPVCLDTITRPVTVISCLHSYCFSCLYTWYRQRTACPLCNVSAASFVTFAIVTTTDRESDSPGRYPIPKKQKSNDSFKDDNFTIDEGGKDQDIELWRFVDNYSSRKPPNNSILSSTSEVNVPDPNHRLSNYSNSNLHKRNLDSMLETSDARNTESEGDILLEVAIHTHRTRFGK